MIKCPMCGMEVDDLEEHKRIMHYGKAKMTTKCPMCGMIVEDLEAHKKNNSSWSVG